MSAPSTSGLSVELLLTVIDVKCGYFTLLYFTLFTGRIVIKVILFLPSLCATKGGTSE